MHVSRDEWPFVRLFPRPGGPLAEWRTGWAQLGELLRGTHGSFGMLADAVVARPPSALERTVVSEFLAEHHDVLEQRCVGLAVGVSNPVVRAAATAVFWVIAPPMPVHFAASSVIAREWLDVRFRDAA